MVRSAQGVRVMQKALVSWCRRLSWGRHWSTKSIRTRQVAFMVLFAADTLKLVVLCGFRYAEQAG